MPPNENGNAMLENRVLEVLEAIREVLSRLATLEEKTVWHNLSMNKLAEVQSKMSDRLSDHEKDQGRIALLERDMQYISGELSKCSKQLEVLTGVLAEIQRNDMSQGKTVGFIEKAGAQFIMAIICAGGGAVAMKLIGG